MKNSGVVQKRSDRISWLRIVENDAMISLEAEKKVGNPDPEYTNILKNRIRECQEESTRYSLVMRVCGNSYVNVMGLT